jgi:hypothetical protein
LSPSAPTARTAPQPVARSGRRLLGHVLRNLQTEYGRIEYCGLPVDGTSLV